MVINTWEHMISIHGITCPRVVTQTNNYMGLVKKFDKGIDYVHIIIHIIWIMFQIMYNFQLLKRG